MKLRLQTWSDMVVPLEDGTGFGQKILSFHEGWIWKKFEMSHLTYTVSINGKIKLSFTTDPNVLKSIIVVQKTIKLRRGLNKIRIEISHGNYIRKDAYEELLDFWPVHTLNIILRLAGTYVGPMKRIF